MSQKGDQFYTALCHWATQNLDCGDGSKKDWVATAFCAKQVWIAKLFCNRDQRDQVTSVVPYEWAHEIRGVQI